MTNQILIVDDSRTARMFIKQCFEIAGFSGCEFLEAAHGAEALDILIQNPSVKLMITDINMPVKDGMELLREMRGIQSLQRIPVIVISSTQNEAREAELLKLGVHGMLAKPLQLPKVAEVLQSLHTAIPKGA